ncbi:hypothetical protein NKDENANG_03485 [Candidatus Entotheonellaceae bacterium PAL068K]
MEGVGDLSYIFWREVTQHTVFHIAQVAGVDEKDFATSVSELVTRFFVFGKEPDARGDLGVGKQLAGERHHAFNAVFFKQAFADFAFIVGIGTHRAVGEQQAHAAVGGQVVEHVLHPGEVGVASGRDAVLPAGVIVFDADVPLFHVKGWIGHDKVGAQVRVFVVAEGVGRFAAEVEVDAAKGHVHGRQAPGGGIGFLAVDRDVAPFAFVFFDEAFALHEESAGAHGRVVNAAFVGLQHVDNEGDDGLGGVILAALFALTQGELAEEVFVDMAEDVSGLQGFVVKRDLGDFVDELAKDVGGYLAAGVVFIEHVFEFGIFLFDFFQGVIDEFANAGECVASLLAVLDVDLRARRDPGVVLQILPTGQGGHPEDVFLGVEVADFQFCLNGRLIVLIGLVIGTQHTVIMCCITQQGFDFLLAFEKRVANVL